jgi:hypothetical protein
MTAPKTTLTAAAKRTVAGLRAAGSLEQVDDLTVATVLYTSHCLDTLDPSTSPAQVASLTRAHLAGC